MRYVSYLLLSFSFLLTSFPATAAKQSSPSTSQIVAIVNKEIITVADVNARVKLFLSTTGGKTTKGMRHQILQTLISERIQVQAARSKKIAVSDKSLKEAITKLAESNNMTAEQMKSMFASKGVPIRTLRDLVEAQLAWIEYIRLLHGGGIHVSEAEIETTLQKIKDRAGGVQYTYVEVFLTVDKREWEAKIRTQANEIATQLRGSASPKSIAQQFSQSASAQNGGLLTLIPESRLDPALARAFKSAKVSDTVVARTSGGYTVAHLTDMQTAGAGNQDDAQVELYQVTFALTDQTPPEDAERIASYVKEFKEIKGCKALENRTKELDGNVEKISARIGDLAPELATLIRKTGIGNALPPLSVNNGVSVVMTCSLKKPTFKIPTHDDVAQMLQEEKISKLAQRERTRLLSIAYIEIKDASEARLQSITERKPSTKVAPAA